MVLIELVQRLESRDRRLVYRKLPRHVLAGLSRGILLPWPTRLSPAAIMSAFRSALLSGRGFRAAAMIRRVLARVPAAWTLGAAPVLWHAAPGVFTFRLRPLVERTVSGARHAFVNGVIASFCLALSAATKRGRELENRCPRLAADASMQWHVSQSEIWRQSWKKWQVNRVKIRNNGNAPLSVLVFAGMIHQNSSFYIKFTIFFTKVPTHSGIRLSWKQRAGYARRGPDGFAVAC